jgi:hypothetical protein
MQSIIKRFLVLIAAAAIFTSCSTCISCTVERLDGTVEAQYDEFCGTQDEIDEFKSEIQETINTTPGSSGWQLKCTEKSN